MSPFRRQWLRDIREHTDMAVSYETMGMFASAIPEFILSIYEHLRFVRRIGERVIITVRGRDHFERYDG